MATVRPLLNTYMARKNFEGRQNGRNTGVRQGTFGKTEEEGRRQDREGGGQGIFRTRVLRVERNIR